MGDASTTIPLPPRFPPGRPSFWTVGRIALALAFGSGLSVLLTLGDPGQTMDERLDVRPGREYVQTLRARGIGFFDRKTVDRVFLHNKEHPPLGRWLLGIASTLGEPVETIFLGRDPVRPESYLLSARVAPAVCFAALVGLVSAAAGRRYGPGAAVVAGFSLAVMPRAFAHAHLGALDTFVALFWTLALLKAVEAADSPRPALAMAFSGVFWGLALLTKIHGWLLPPVVLAWVLVRLPIRRAIPAMALWGLVGLAVFFAGWPWLWYDSWDRLSAYLATGVRRDPIRVLYFGSIYADREVPWHYPWVYFGATVPVGLLILGGIGASRGVRDRRDDPFGLLLLGTIVGWLVLFSTKVPIYDGERLFLPAFPLLALLVGRGFAAVWDDLTNRPTWKAALVAATLFQAVGVVTIHPFGLSYYNVLVGGLPGAEKLGLELTYWGDSVDRVLLDRLAREAQAGSPCALAPTLVPEQGRAMTTRKMAQKPVALDDQEALDRSEWVVLYRRDAYWTPEMRALASRPPAFVRSRQGVWLSGLWRR